MARPPASEQVQVNFRMPVDLRDRIKRAADENGRSVTAEIVDALEGAFPPPREVNDVLKDVAFHLAFVEPGLRQEAIEALKASIESGWLEKWATVEHTDRGVEFQFPGKDEMPDSS